MCLYRDILTAIRGDRNGLGRIRSRHSHLFQGSQWKGESVVCPCVCRRHVWSSPLASGYSASYQTLPRGGHSAINHEKGNSPYCVHHITNCLSFTDMTPYPISSLTWVDVCSYCSLHTLTHMGSPSPQPVMHEFYDEIVFTNPSPSFEAALMQYVPPPVKPLSHLTVWQIWQIYL